MSRDVDQYVLSCSRCFRLKAVPEHTKLSPIFVSRPMELVHMDCLTIESGKSDKDVNVLVITDHFTFYAQAFIIRSQTVNVVANTLWECFFSHYGLPEKMLSDQGQNFESKLIRELCQLRLRS